MMVVEIEGLRRGLIVLDTLLEHGPLNLTELGEYTSLPLATVMRILETLRTAGHVRRGVGKHLWRATTIKSTESWSNLAFAVSEVSAAPIMELCRRIPWPADVGVYENLNIQIVETSRLASPLLSRSPTTQTVSVIPSAIGTAILSFTTDEHRSQILQDLESEILDHDDYKLHLLAVIKRTRARGYAEPLYGLPEGRYKDYMYNSIAMPIMHKEKAFGAISVSWIAGVATPNKFYKAHICELKETIEKVENNLFELLKKKKKIEV
ncbi:helix-turn-helix domain-containing protein (plasmid) [Paracoccus liaowanqingii]|uniref:Helix-turn-helix domain-containing protein n=1 Tax=Paracoccus liaowanqingii TaxID=2560053 RepID=A0A4Y5SRY2_9RHOB|nr:helix-turn-helix domain-containing protein [Paracoccus liaowanqingii]QDA35693.1 helix-turn-helix domain-containing protein [Paracoccus liaowanqingii]